MKSPKVLIAIGFVAGFGVGVFVWQQFVTARLAAENQQLREEVKMVAVLTDENVRLTSERIDPAELKRLRDGQAELLRLRGQVSQLRREAQDAKAAAAKAAQQMAAQTPPTAQPTNDLPVEIFTANATANVGWGMAVVTGGWRLPSGKRGFVLLQPSDAGDSSVLVNSRIVELPENLLASFGLDALKADGNAGRGNGILSAEQLQDLLKRLEKTEGVEVLMAPRVTTPSGRQAQVQAVDHHALPSGQTYTTGQIIEVTPTIAADKQSVELVVGAQLNLPRVKN